MKKNILYLGMLLLGMTMMSASCSDNDDPKPSPTPVETPDEAADIDYKASNADNWHKYTVAVARLLSNDASSLLGAWNDSYKGGESYAVTFKSAKGAYKSYNDCLQEIIEGCADIANEVGESKIGDPYEKKMSGKDQEALYAVESWFSWHSRDDYTNNIYSIKNSFYGNLGNTITSSKYDENSIASYVRKNNPDLFDKVNDAINDAAQAIQNIPQPFRNNINSKEAEAAMEACSALEKVLSNDLKPYIISQDADEAYGTIVAAYVDGVVLPTYKDLNDKVQALLAAVTTLNASRTTSNFAAAAEAWLQARAPWETSEAFLFGPVGDLGLDPNMDSWPLDQEAIVNILEKGDFGSLDWNGEYDEDSEDISAAQEVRGFHTLEFLLFKDGEARKVK